MQFTKERFEAQKNFENTLHKFQVCLFMRDPGNFVSFMLINCIVYHSLVDLGDILFIYLFIYLLFKS